MATYSTSKKLIKQYDKSHKDRILGFGPAGESPKRLRVKAYFPRSRYGATDEHGMMICLHAVA